jgi:type I restriction enzyme S subunit
MTSTGEWKPRRLGELVKLTSGQSPTGFRFGATGTPYFKVDQLGKSAKYLGRDQTPYLAEDLPQVPAGSVLIAKRGGAIALNRVRVLSEPGFMDTNVMALTPGPDIRSEFLYYWLAYRGLWDIADVTSVPQINNKHIIPLEIRLPDRDEQLAIVRALKEADNLVALTAGWIAKKRDIKQGLMQELLTGRTRLPGFTDEWRTVSLGQLGTFLKGRGVKRDDVKTRGVPCIRYGELYTTYRNYTASTVSFVEPHVAATALPIRNADVLFAGSGETKEEIGMSVAYIGDDSAVAGGDIIVLRGAGYDPVFLASLLNTPEVASQKARRGQGDAVVHINWRALAAIEVKVPSPAEQTAIARILLDADSEVRAQENRLRSARAIKTGMMQELLSGRTRLPVEVAS